MTRTLERILAWTESLTDAIRPAAYGALVIVFLMLLKGAWLVAPLAILAVVFFSETPLPDLTVGAGVVGLAIAGGAFAGLVYGLIGRPLNSLPFAGRYLAGVVTVMPYLLVVTVIIRITEHQPLWAPLRRAEWVSFAICTVIFGLTIGHMWFPAQGRSRPRRRPT